MPRPCPRRSAPLSGRPPALGFTLIEVMVTVAIIAVGVVLGAPQFLRTASTARERSAVQKFTQDYDWARSKAGVATVSITLNADCTWTTTVNAVADSAHSLNSTARAALSNQLACAATGIAMPATLSFSAQGFVTPTGQLSFTGGSGQTWQLQLLFSGSMLRLNGSR